MPVRAGTLLTLWLLACYMPVQAGQVYRWKDVDGITHYGDQQPLHEGAERVVVPGGDEPAAVASLRVEDTGRGFFAWADNRLAGPIEVMLHFDHHENVDSDPALPARATVAAGASGLVAVLSAAEPGRPLEFQLRMDSLPGHPSASPRDVRYRVPVAGDVRVDQGFGGGFSHQDPENRYAMDFAVPSGTSVLAARAGVVMQAEAGFEHGGLDRAALAGRANFVRVLHDDGTMALYAHLQPGGVLVRVGQHVEAGQPLGLSGATGFASGPHLHFAVQVNRGMRLVSLPFRLEQAGGKGADDGSGALPQR
ncbi:MAG: M23 family metallopeptidase [Lysobacter spongiicola]|nr:M23 family metallopeptidase [Lysobacter spongiicola]